jgi:hypothetical protein
MVTEYARLPNAPGERGRTMKVARGALQLPLALWERAGVRETGMATATYVFSGGVDAMAVRSFIEGSPWNRIR